MTRKVRKNRYSFPLKCAIVFFMIRNEKIGSSEKDASATSSNPPSSGFSPGVIFFDGDCGVCKAVVWALASSAKSGNFRFSPLQGSTYAGVLERHPELKKVDSVIFIENLLLEHSAFEHSEARSVDRMTELVFTRGSAVLEILKRAQKGWTILRLIALITPNFLRNFFYDFFARHRTLIMRPTDRKPTAEEAHLFLE